MELSNLMGGGTPLVKSYQVDATISNVGIPLLIDTAGQAGLNLATTTSAADMVGVNLDTVTYTTTQGTGASSAERKVRVIVNPDAIYRIRLSGGATEGTALTQHTVGAANAGGTTVDVDGTNFSSPNFDEGVSWGYSGANAGQVRKITTANDGDFVVTIPYDNSIAVGDVFLIAPYWFNATTTVQLTTNLYEADASIAVATGAGFKVVDMDLRDSGAEGTLKSFAFILPTDHVYGHRPT